MSKYASQTPKPRSPIATGTQRVFTHTGGLGYERDAKSELFLLAVTNMASEDTFHEAAKSRDSRFRDLVHTVTKDDPEWVAALVPYLRDTMQMRSASVVLAAEYVAAGGPNGRDVVRKALRRADEPAELLAYWMLSYGRAIPKPIKRGIADAITGGRVTEFDDPDTGQQIRERGLYNQRSSLRYDGTDRAWRFGDVIEIVHPKPNTAKQSALFCYLLDKRHGHASEIDPELLSILATDQILRELPEDVRRGALTTPAFREAGWSWERLAGWLPGGMDAQAWEAVIPQMGYMALLRNLRNFEEAKISAGARGAVIEKLVNPDEVRESRQFPIRFYSAYKELPSFVYTAALETAQDLTLQNVPSLPGRTLILVDLSPSMAMGTVSKKSKRKSYEIASVFASALARRAENAQLVVYSGDSEDLTERARKQPTLRFVETANDWVERHGNGTYTFTALNRWYNGHDRVVIITDGQAHDAGKPIEVPNTVPVYTFNVGGYRPAHLPSGEDNRYEFAGGLTDSGFTLLSVLDAKRSTDWSFLTA